MKSVANKANNKIYIIQNVDKKIPLETIARNKDLRLDALLETSRRFAIPTVKLNARGQLVRVLPVKPGIETAHSPHEFGAWLVPQAARRKREPPFGRVPAEMSRPQVEKPGTVPMQQVKVELEYAFANQSPLSLTQLSRLQPLGGLYGYRELVA